MENFPGRSLPLTLLTYLILTDSNRSQKTSHPIGTTVRIQNFLKYIPVRRQAALKGATKCLAKIKTLIQTYAMAQPSKRFSFKVLKAKNENNNWSFAPGPDLALADAAVKVVGRDVASCCTTKQSTSTVNSTSDGSLSQATYQVMAFLPRVDTSTLPRLCMRRSWANDRRSHNGQQQGPISQYRR